MPKQTVGTQTQAFLQLVDIEKHAGLPAERAVKKVVAKYPGIHAAMLSEAKASAQANTVTAKPVASTVARDRFRKRIDELKATGKSQIQAINHIVQNENHLVTAANSEQAAAA